MPKRVQKPKPFVKWAGGKSQLLRDIWANLPSSFQNYFEPFVGGGAVFFALYREGLLSGKSYLSDNNPELILAYQTIQTKVDALIQELNRSEKYQNDRDIYYEIRAWEPDDAVERTARFIYLNHTCYNGLYRVNKKGKFNVPFGRYKNPQILDQDNLEAVSRALEKVELRGPTDFAQAVDDAKANDFIYFDPPYQPLSDTAHFTSYTKGGFSFKEQQRLADIFRQLANRNCSVLESNSDTDEIRDLYNEFHIVEVFAKRAISCDPTGRGAISELLIRNYVPPKKQTTIPDFT